MTIEEIISEVKKYNCKLVEITGGEPLVQENVHSLMSKLCDYGYTVMIETGGSLTVKNIDERVKIIMDLKTPTSAMMHRNMYENIDLLKKYDEIKFVIENREDYEWSKNIIKNYNLTDRFNVLFSPVFTKLQNIELAKWILEDKLNVRFQIQLHKYIWHPETKGV